MISRPKVTTRLTAFVGVTGCGCQPQAFKTGSRRIAISMSTSRDRLEARRSEKRSVESIPGSKMDHPALPPKPRTLEVPTESFVSPAPPKQASLRELLAGRRLQSTPEPSTALQLRVGEGRSLMLPSK